MANEPISFSCPACGIKLTVPGNLAGVTGPCPSCRTLIQAPYPAPPAAPAYQPPSPAPVVYEPVAAAAPVYQAPPPVPVATTPEPISPPAPAALRPEPRQLPNRSNHAEPVAKPMPEPNRGSEMSKASHALPRHPRQGNRFIRLLTPLIFLIASGAIVFGVLTILKKQSKDASRKVPGQGSTVLPILPEETRRTKTPAVPQAQDLPALPVPEPELPSIVEPPPPLPDGIEPATPGEAAMDVLEKFLAAKTLDGHLAMAETQTPKPDLAKSCLAGPLPAARGVLIYAQETNAVEQVVDIYYNVDFDAGNNRLNPQTILVRTRGTGDPKVVVDPFLDSFGGRLAAYVKSPSEKAGIFQVIISAVASCNDERVPNREKKLTLKLLPRDNTKEIAQAYFGRQSKIGRMLEDGTYSLSYGKAKACTVMLHWNVEDKPENPYLEALDLKTLDWNP